MRGIQWSLLSVLLVGWAATWVHGANNVSTETAGVPLAAADEAPKLPKTDKPPKPADMAPDREREVLGFVTTNHPELGNLLKQLSKTNPSEYQHALRDLSRTVDRLAQTLEHNPAKYDVELARWKMQSRIQVLVAKLSISDDNNTRSKLRQAVANELDMERKLLKADRDRLSAKVAEFDGRLKTLETDRQSIIDSRVDRLVKNIKRPNGKPKANEGNKPAATTSVEPKNKSQAED